MDKRPEGRPDLDALASALLGSIDGAAIVAWVVPPLLEHLSEGRPVSPATLSVALSRPVEEITDAIARLPNVEVDERGQVVGYGLTLRPTPHRVEIDGRRLHAWCALDTLILPVLLGRTFQVESHCPSTGRMVRVQVGPRGVEEADPAGAVVSIVPPGDPADLRESFCSHVHFLSSATAASSWLAGRDGATVISIEEAFGLGHRLAESMLGAVSSTAKQPSGLRGHDWLARKAAFGAILATGQPWDPEGSEIEGMDPVAVRAAIDHLVAAGRARTNERGLVTAAAGLSVDPTPHRIETARGARWTNCAYDALGILGALGGDGVIESISPGNGALIRVAFEQGRPRGSHAVLFFADQSCCTRPNDEWCPNVNLFVDGSAALAWAGEHGVAGRVLSLEEGTDLGAMEWRPLIGEATGAEA